MVGYGLSPPRVVWPDGAALALNIVVNYEEGSEYSKPAGDQPNEGQDELDYLMDDAYRDLGVESSYESGSPRASRSPSGGSQPRKLVTGRNPKPSRGRPR